MTGPRPVPDDPIAAALAKAQGTDPIAAALAKSATGETREQMLARRDKAEQQAEGPNFKAGLGTKMLGTAASLGADIPGVPALQAGIRALLRGKAPPMMLPGGVMLPNPADYEEARKQNTGLLDATPKTLRVPARLAGGAVAGMALPGSPMVQGTLYGGAAGALDPNADVGLGERALKAGSGAVIGGAVGKLGDMAIQGGKALLADNPSAQVVAKANALRAEAAKLYGAVKDTPEVQTVAQKWMGDPDFKLAIKAAAKEKGLPEDAANPEVLQLAKQIVRRTVNRGYTVDAPLPREVAVRVAPKLSDFTDELHTASPELATADAHFWQAKTAESAFDRGYAAMRSKSGTAPPPTGQLKTTTPEALSDWLANPTRAPGARDAAQQGVTGFTKEAVGRAASLSPASWVRGASALGRAGNVARTLRPENAPKSLLDYLQTIAATRAGHEGTDPVGMGLDMFNRVLP